MLTISYNHIWSIKFLKEPVFQVEETRVHWFLNILYGDAVEVAVLK